MSTTDFLSYIRTRKLVIAIIAGTLVAAYAGFHFYAARKAAMQGAMPELSVGVSSVIEKEIIEWDEFSGRLQAVEHVEVRPLVSGTIEQIHFREGDILEKGAKLFTIDQRPFIAALQRADAAVEAAKSKLVLVRKDKERAAKLLPEKFVTERDFEVRQDAVRAADAALRSAKAEQETARLNLEYTDIRAPISGKVSRAEITVGNIVTSGPNAPLLTSITSVTPIYADFEIDERSYLRYVKAQGTSPEVIRNIPITMSLSGEKDFLHKGHISSFDNKLNTASGTIRARAVFDNKEGKLTPGMFVKLQVGGSGKHKALLISEKAVQTDQNKKFVLTAEEDGTLAYKEVKLGGNVDGLRVVREGLKAGDKVVMTDLQKVRPGIKVKSYALEEAPVAKQ